MFARENLLNKLVKKIGRPRGLYFPGESSKPVVPEPMVQNNRKVTLEKTVFFGNDGVIVAFFLLAIY